MEKLEINAITSDMLTKDTALLSPCYHWETRVTLMDGVFILHCDQSVLVEGECTKNLGLLITHADVLRTLTAWSIDAETKYQGQFICIPCNGELDKADRRRDMKVDFEKKTSMVTIRCVECGGIVSRVKLKSRLDVS